MDRVADGAAQGRDRQATATPTSTPATVTATPVHVPPPGGPVRTIVRLEAATVTETKEARWLSRSPTFPTPTTRSSRTSTRRRCASITTSTTRPTSTKRTPPSRAPSGPTRTSRRSSRTSPACPATSRAPVRNNAGGHYNHSLFWQMMSPDGGGEPERRAGRRDRRGLRLLRLLQGGVQKRRHRPLRLRLGLAGQGRLRPRGRLDAEPGLADLRRADAAARRRRLGARLLPEVPEQAPRLHRRLLERRQLGLRRRSASPAS